MVTVEDFQEIRRIEIKMLPSPRGRDRNSSAKEVLTREECLRYATFLEEQGQKRAAEYFREYK